MAAREGTVLGRACHHARGHGRWRAVPRNESRRRVLHGIRCERKRRAQSGTCTSHMSEAPPLRHGAARVHWSVGYFCCRCCFMCRSRTPSTRPDQRGSLLRFAAPSPSTRAPASRGAEHLRLCCRDVHAGATASWRCGRRSAVAVSSCRRTESLPALIKGRRDARTPRHRLPACRFKRHSLPGLASQPAAAHHLLLLAVLASL